MILEMSKISVLGLHSERKAVLEALHKRELVELSQPDAAHIRFQETEKSVAQFEKYMQSAQAALAVLDSYAPDKKPSGLFAGRRVLPAQKYHMASSDSDAVLRLVYRVLSLSDDIREHRESIRKIEAKQTALEPYLALDIPMNVSGTRDTLMKTGALQGLWTREGLQKELEARELEAAHAELLSASREHSYVWFVFLKAQEKSAEAFLQKIGFVPPPFRLSQWTPTQKRALLEEEKAALIQKIQEAAAEITECGERRRDIELFYDHLCLRKDKYQALARMGMMEHSFLLEGYIPKKQGESLRQLLEDKWTVCVELAAPEHPEDVPVMFQNNLFAAPVETITETYSMPSPTDVDPNPVMAFFYYLFFGMMFSDAGYGLLLALVCGYLGFSKQLEKAKRKNYRMFFFCGLSTVFWGLMFGSFFGDMTYTVASAFFGKEFSLAPLWLDPINQAMQLLIASVALGLVQILAGLGLKFYALCKQKKYIDAICDAGFWMLTLLGIGGFAAGAAIPALKTAGMWAAIAGAAGLVATGGRKSKNIFGKVLGGITGLYDITGYASDALSYCRLMALGLATGSISNVVNMLCAMFGKSVLGVILFIVVAVAGHGMNFAINALGAYVHTNRLKYVEFFSKFYEGGGRRFTPLQMRTKYHQFSEE